jgi:hypothetical protein
MYQEGVETTAAENNACYGMYEEGVETTAAESVEEARDRARRSYPPMTVQDLVPLAVERVMDTARQHDARAGRQHGKRVAEAFPNLARAQYLNPYMDLRRRTLVMAERRRRPSPFRS